MVQNLRPVVMKDAATKSSEEEFAEGMGQKAKLAVKMDAPAMSSKEEYAPDMEQSVQQKQEGGVCVRHGAEVKKCNHEGCNNIVIKGGVCQKARLTAQMKTYKTCNQEVCANYCGMVQ